MRSFKNIDSQIPPPRDSYRRRQWHPTPVLLPGRSHGRRSLVGCSPWGRWELDTTERLHFHFSLSCIGEGNGNPLWCSCLENPRDGGAWWAAVYGVAQSWTWLKRLSSSSSSRDSYSVWAGAPELASLLKLPAETTCSCSTGYKGQRAYWGFAAAIWEITTSPPSDGHLPCLWWF